MRLTVLAVLLLVVAPALLGYAASFSIELKGSSTEYRIPIEDVETIEQIGGPETQAAVNWLPQPGPAGEAREPEQAGITTSDNPTVADESGDAAETTDAAEGTPTSGE